MYTSFYKLREEPFRLTSDPRFFHLAQPHARVLTILMDAIVRRKGFVVMTGPIGTGKTTVVHTTLQILAKKSSAQSPIASAFILNPTLTRDEFLEMILTEFEIPCTAVSKPARLAALQRMLMSTHQKGGTSLLLVDEAHLLSPELLEEIRLLSNADTYKEKLLQIVLCGQPELLGVLGRPELRALKQRIAASCSLRPLSLPEVHSYINERMSAAGFSGATSPFTTPTLEGIFRITQGVPRLVNLLCDSSLSIGCRMRQPVLDMITVEEAASELEMTEASVKQQLATPVKDSEVSAATDAVVGSALDFLIRAMKKTRGPALATESGQTALLGERKPFVPAGSAMNENSSDDAVIASAVDVLIQAMKLRRTSTMEL